MDYSPPSQDRLEFYDLISTLDFTGRALAFLHFECGVEAGDLAKAFNCAEREVDRKLSEACELLREAIEEDV